MKREEFKKKINEVLQGERGEYHFHGNKREGVDAENLWYQANLIIKCFPYDKGSAGHYYGNLVVKWEGKECKYELLHKVTKEEMKKGEWEGYKEGDYTNRFVDWKRLIYIGLQVLEENFNKFELKIGEESGVMLRASRDMVLVTNGSKLKNMMKSDGLL